MASQDWLSPAAAPDPSSYQTVVPAPGFGRGSYELRPLSLGELLDRTFAIYRSRFWLFAGIASMAAAVELVLSGLGRVALHASTSNVTTTNLVTIVIGYTAALVYFLVYAVTQAATSYALAETYLGRGTTVGSSFEAVRGKWYAWIGIALWQMWSAMWVMVAITIPVALIAGVGAFLGTRGGGGAATGALVAFVLLVGMLGGGVYGVIAFMRNALAVPAKVVEGMPVRAAMRRSKTLAKGALGRIFVLFVIVVALYMVAMVLEAPFSFMVLAARGTGHVPTGRVIAEATMLLINFVARTVVTPVMAIGLCLVYFDQRVRTEAFDLEFLLGPERGPVAAAGVQGEVGPDGDAPQA